MEDRQITCKNLKKAYKKERRRALWVWKLLFFFALAVVLLCALAWGWLNFRDTDFIPELGFDWLWEYARLVEDLVLWVALGGLVLLAFAGVRWGLGSSRCKKSAAYLDWRTLKTALEAEQEER